MYNRSRRDVLGLSAAGLAALAGCLGGASSPEEEDEEPEIEPADWRTTTLEDVTTGEAFRMGEFDVPLVLHTFAIWCGSCRTQQKELAAFHDSYDGEVVGVDLNVDENEDAARVREHVEENGHGWRFAISPPELTRGLVDEFSPKLAAGPGSPVVIISPEGEVTIHDDVVTDAADIEATVANY